ncbi:MAG TPA: hypothetical protein VGR46_11755 [Candidatus Limnocylindria bacterium]|jgi:hypothetical protein|nr:hypothetical protein [Candidatus Limnocylindria bacterium]
MSFITGLITGIVIAGAWVALEQYGSLIPPIGPFALSGNGAVAAAEVLVPIAIFWGWSWATNRWSGRSLIPATLYTIGLALGVGVSVPVDAVFFPANPDSTLANAVPGLAAVATIFVLVPAIVAAAFYLPLKSGWIPTNAIVLAIGYLIGLPLALLYPMVTMGTVAGTAAGHAWKSTGAKTFIAILVIVLMAIAIFGIPYLMSSGVPRFPR